MEDHLQELENNSDNQLETITSVGEKDKNNEERKKPKTGLLVAIVLIIAIGASLVIFLPKYLHINKANNARNNKDYESAIVEYGLADGFFKSDEKQQETYIEYAIDCIEHDSYDKMLEILTFVNDPEKALSVRIDAANRCMSNGSYIDMIKVLSGVDQTEDIRAIYINSATDCIKKKEYDDAVSILNALSSTVGVEDLWKACGIGYTEDKNYVEAASALKELSDSESKHYYYYAQAQLDIQDKKYDTAIQNLTKTDGLLDSQALVYKTYYIWGKSLISQDISKAKQCFEKASDYEDAEEMITVCDFLAAEKLLSSQKYEDALVAYKNLPSGFAYNGISAASRIDLLKSASVLINSVGTWRTTSNYIESRNVHISTGIWENWYIDQTNTSQRIEISISLNTSGTFDLSGKVSFYRFTNYSSLKAYCNASLATLSFEAKNIKTMPNSFNVGSNATLTFSNGAFKLKYSVRDNYSSHFYYLYNSTVTYGNH